MKKEDIIILSQLVKTLEEIEPKLEESYNKKDFEEFNKLKKLMLNLQKKVSIILK